MSSTSLGENIIITIIIINVIIGREHDATQIGRVTPLTMTGTAGVMSARLINVARLPDLRANHPAPSSARAPKTSTYIYLAATMNVLARTILMLAPPAHVGV